MNQPTQFPKEEFLARIKRVQENMATCSLDALIAFSSSGEPQYARYLADFRVSFETCAVAVPRKGDASLLVGPETNERASRYDVLGSMKRMLAFREPAAPKYEDNSFDTFEALLKAYHDVHPLRRLGIAGWRILPMDIFREIKDALFTVAPEAEIVDADEAVDLARSHKTPLELECLCHAAKIARQTMEYVLQNIRVGMTGGQIKGLALSKMHELGAEGEAFPMWMTCNEDTAFAISVSSKDVVKEGDLWQLQIGANYHGYASAIGRPVVIGRASDAQRELIESCILAKEVVEDALEQKMSSGQVAAAHRQEVIRQGHEHWLVYGPCHSIGTVECEFPWIEEGKDYPLRAGMVFCVDIFFHDAASHRGVRYEDMVLITELGVERLTGFPNELIEIPLS